MNDKFIIGFGKHTGTKITDMLNKEQITYLEWIVKTFDNKNPAYKAAKWWLNTDRDNYSTEETRLSIERSINYPRIYKHRLDPNTLASIEASI